MDINKEDKNDQKKKIQMEFLYKALDNGWIIKKLENNKYELTRNNNGNSNNDSNNEYESPRRSISSPIVKNINFKFKN